MKKKAIFKVLPALLAFPLAMLIGGVAYANDFSFENFVSNIKSFDLLNNELSTLNSNTQSTNGFSSGIDGYTPLPGTYKTTDNCLNFNVYLTPNGSEKVAFISGIRTGILDNSEFMNTHILNIPITISGLPIDGSGTVEDYNVHAIDQNGLNGGNTIGDDYVRKNLIKEIIINGYGIDADGKVTGGWFKYIKTGGLADYLYTTERDVQLESITIPDCIEGWGTTVFNNNNKMTEIKRQYISGDEIKEEVGLPRSLSYIPEESFCDCTSLTFGDKGLVIDSNIQHIGYQSFVRCTALNTIDFSEASGLTKIQFEAFLECSELTHLKFPKNLTHLENDAFRDCYKLNNIEFNEGLTSIGNYCFSNRSADPTDTTASQLQYLYLPESLETLGMGALQNSQHLKEVIIGMQDARDCTIHEGAFSNCPELLSTTYIWNSPWQVHSESYKGGPHTKVYALCDETKALDVRFRPLTEQSELGRCGQNGFLDFYGHDGETIRWDDIAPTGSRLMLIAAFDDGPDGKYKNDLKRYLNESTGIFDNATFETKNATYLHKETEVQYVIGITIPDVLKMEKTTNSIFKTYAKTADTAGNRSKGIEFIYDETNVHQITHKGKDLNRPADDGVLIINNNAIQVNSNNTLYVNYRAKKGTKSNPCIYGHGAVSSNNPFQGTYDYLTADASQMDSLGQNADSINNPVICNNAPEDEIVDEEKPLLKAFGSGETDVTVPNACCFFSKPGGTVKDVKYNSAKLSIKNITFGGKWTDNSVPDEERKTVDVGNSCQLGCVYNDGDLTMSNCTFKNSAGTWSGTTAKGDSYGGSCLFNYRSATVTECTMDSCSAAYDGGAVMNAGTLNMVSCTINECTAAHYGGAIFNNLGDSERGGDTSTGLTITGCTFTKNTAGNGGAIYYCNGATLKLDENPIENSLTFSNNTDNNGTCDVFIGIKKAKTTLIEPLTLGDSFRYSGTITLAFQNPKNGLVVCTGGASYINSFASQNESYVLTGSGDDIALQTATTDYTLTTDGNGVWVDEEDNEVQTFSAAGTTAPEAGKTITYKDAEGKSHTLTAKPKDGYEFSECTLTGTTYQATFATVTPSQQNIINITSKVKESINNRNADAKENAKLEIYAR